MKKTKAGLTFTKRKTHLDDPQDFWANILWTDEAKVEVSGKFRSWCKTDSNSWRASYQQSGMVVVVWWSRVALAPGWLALIDGAVNSALYQEILRDSVDPMKNTWVRQQHENPPVWLKQFCKEEWAKIAPERCETLTASYHEPLIAVLTAKGGRTSY